MVERGLSSNEVGTEGNETNEAFEAPTTGEVGGVEINTEKQANTDSQQSEAPIVSETQRSRASKESNKIEGGANGSKIVESAFNGANVTPAELQEAMTNQFEKDAA